MPMVIYSKYIFNSMYGRARKSPLELITNISFIQCWIFCGGRKTGELKQNPLSKKANHQQSQPTYDTRSKISTRVSFVIGEGSLCSISAPRLSARQTVLEVSEIHGTVQFGAHLKLHLKHDKKCIARYFKIN